MIAGLIVGHRRFSESLLDAVESISGKPENIICISNEGLSTNELSESIQKHCRKHSREGSVIFVDLFGGSCWRAAKMARVENAHIITGVNLPMFLSFLHKRQTIPVDELTAVLDTDGKRGIVAE